MLKMAGLFVNKVILNEDGDLVQNIMWLAFIAFACIVAVGALGGSLGDAADKASSKIDDAITVDG